jgi:allantoinase
VNDVVIRGGTLVTPSGPQLAGVAIADGTIREISEDLPAGREEIDANGLVVLPGVIDVRLHFNEPGRTDWEGAATGSRALAAGGGTVFFDMPLNSTPCTVNAREFDRKRAALEASPRSSRQSRRGAFESAAKAQSSQGWMPIWRWSI